MNHSSTQIGKMIMPALMIKPRARSHMWISTPFIEGMW